MIGEAQFRQKKDAQEVRTRFQERVGDISFWKSELEAKLTELKEDISNVEVQRDRVGQALKATADPLNVAEKCLAHRNQRQGIVNKNG